MPSQAGPTTPGNASELLLHRSHILRERAVAVLKTIGSVHHMRVQTSSSTCHNPWTGPSVLSIAQSLVPVFDRNSLPVTVGKNANALPRPSQNLERPGKKQLGSDL